MYLINRGFRRLDISIRVILFAPKEKTRPAPSRNYWSFGGAGSSCFDFPTNRSCGAIGSWLNRSPDSRIDRSFAGGEDREGKKEKSVVNSFSIWVTRCGKTDRERAPWDRRSRRFGSATGTVRHSAACTTEGVFSTSGILDEPIGGSRPFAAQNPRTASNWLFGSASLVVSSTGERDVINFLEHR